MTRFAAYLSAFLMSLLIGSAGFAAPVVDLVTERAEQEFGSAMPANGVLDIRLAEGLPREGEFIQEFWIDKDSGQFIANVVSAYGDVTRVWGVAILTLPVPIVNRRIQVDEIVGPNDIDMIDMPWARVHAFAITDYEDLVGMQVRRMLSPGRPIHHQSVMQPIVVARGDKVTIELSYGGLQLTARGKAITDAHLGQEVRVVNLSSNKTIIAIATGDGLVEAQF